MFAVPFVFRGGRRCAVYRLDSIPMSEYLPDIIFIAGFVQLCVLIASSLVPLRLNWKSSLDVLPKLHRQLYWVYGGYVVMGIIFNGSVAIVCADELAAGTTLARFVCGY